MFQWVVRFTYPVVVCVTYLVLTVTSLERKSVTFDELGHLTGGYSSWVTADHRLFQQNGQFPKRWATWPLLFQDLRLPPLDQPAWRHSDVDRFGYQFLYTQGNDLSALLRAGRIMMVFNGLLLGIVVYVWSQLLFGIAGANISLTLCLFSPAVLAHSRLVTSDITAALTFTLSLFFTWSLLHKVTPSRMLGCAVSVGLLCVTKMSALIIGPILAVLFVVRLLWGLPLLIHFRGRLRVIRTRIPQLALLCGAFSIVLIGAWITIWAFYGFRYGAVGELSHHRQSVFFGESIDSLTAHGSAGGLVRFARDYRMLPESYLFGLAHVLAHSRGHPAFLNGRYSLTGFKSFLPVTAVLKTPIPFFLIALLALAAVRDRMKQAGVAGRWVRLRRGFYRSAPLWFFLMIYWIVAVHFRLSIGERHVLPAYPAAFILCGAAGYWFQRSPGKANTVSAQYSVIACLLWAIVESVAIWPHFLAYFNPLAGGPKNGYRYLVDSSLDWGQDLIGLRQWIGQHQSIGEQDAPIYVAYFGTGDLQYYEIPAQRLPGYLDFDPQMMPHELKAGVYCISATILQSVYNPARGPWNARYEQLYRDRLALFSNPMNAQHAEAESAEFGHHWREFDQLRLARLCAHLRHREPDDNIGYSILIYQVSDAELKAALGLK